MLIHTSVTYWIVAFLNKVDIANFRLVDSNTSVVTGKGWKNENLVMILVKQLWSHFPYYK